MYSVKHISSRFSMMFAWRSVVVFLLYSFVICALYIWADWTFLSMPFIPIATVGTAVAFYIGFKNNFYYERLGECWRIWGELVNASRSWGVMVMDYISNLEAPIFCPPAELYRIQQMLIYRHIAYLNALRIQVNGRKVWKEKAHPEDSPAENPRGFDQGLLDKELSMFLHDEEVEYFVNRQNPATQIIRRQSAQLRELRAAGLISESYHSDLEHTLTEFYAQQGAAERVKAFPFSRQYAFFSYLFVRLFIAILPFGLLSEMAKLSNWHVWLTIPFYTIVACIFYTIEVVGDAGDNPFETSISDGCMTAICRNVEIDLREMLGETNIPHQVQVVDNIMM